MPVDSLPQQKSEQKREEHGCIAYITILDIVETRDIILWYNISDLYNNRMLKPVKQFFSCRTLYIYMYIVFLFKSCF